MQGLLVELLLDALTQTDGRLCSATVELMLQINGEAAETV
jgi:hypothetical protein